MHDPEELHALSVPVRLRASSCGNGPWWQVLPLGAPCQRVCAFVRLAVSDVRKEDAVEIQVRMGVEHGVRAVRDERGLAVEVRKKESAEVLLEAAGVLVRKGTVVAERNELLLCVRLVNEL